MKPERLPAAGLLWPLALALPALAILLALGTWQMQRKAWKEDLLARISARVNQPPVPLAEALAQSAGNLEYARVRARGTFVHGSEQLLWAPDPRLGPGYDVVTPLRLGDGRFILVNRGYVTEALRWPPAESPPIVATGGSPSASKPSRSSHSAASSQSSSAAGYGCSGARR